jgi:hypothetical protein
MSNKKCTNTDFGNHTNRTAKKFSDKCPGKVYCYVHELVAQAFVPNPDNLPYVDHKDGDRLNNHADNLFWTAVKPEGYVKL